MLHIIIEATDLELTFNIHWTCDGKPTGLKLLTQSSKGVYKAE